MANQHKNKVVYNGNTLIDLTSTTATADKILTGFGAFGADGAWMNGTASGGVDGDNLAYGLSLVGSAIVGSSIVS